jgi:hypothetical protein
MFSHLASYKLQPAFITEKDRFIRIDLPTTGMVRVALVKLVNFTFFIILLEFLVAFNFLGNPHYTLPLFFPWKMTCVDTICLLISTSRSPKVVGVAPDV